MVFSCTPNLAKYALKKCELTYCTLENVRACFVEQSGFRKFQNYCRFQFYSFHCLSRLLLSVILSSRIRLSIFVFNFLLHFSTFFPVERISHPLLLQQVKLFNGRICAEIHRCCSDCIITCVFDIYKGNPDW